MFQSKLHIYFLNNFCDFVFFLNFSLILYFRKSNLYSRFLIFAFWYLLSILYLLKPNLQYPFSLENEIKGLTALSSFGFSFFSTPGHAVCPLPLLFSKLCESLCFPDGGEHLGNWLLAGSVSLLLIPLFILLATSVSFLPLLFSV